MIRVAINGFGRIGRAFYKLASVNKNIQIVAINDLAKKTDLEYLLKYDSVYGRFDISPLAKVKFFQEKDPKNLPWREMNIDIVVESTGFFRDKSKAQAHLDAGAKRVVISAPSNDATTVLVGANEEKLNTCEISSNASCTTNSINPIVGIMEEAVGIESALLNTIHAYTATQSIVDSINKKDLRRGRTAGINIIPTTTGAAKATAKAHKNLEGKFDGIALRVPVPAGSIADLTFIAKTEKTKEEINEILKTSAQMEKWKRVFAVTDEPLVSTDILGRPKASIADLSMTRTAGKLVKILAWYDNEVGYASSLLHHILSIKL